MSQIAYDSNYFSAVNTLTGDVGGAIGPTLNNINIVGSSNIDVTGNAAISTLTVSLSAAFADDIFRIIDNADNTKQLAFECSGITAATTRTITMDDRNIDMDAVPDSFVSDAGTATPAAGSLTIVGGTNVATTGVGSTITINATPSAAGYIWNNVTGATQSLAIDNGYIANRVAGNVAFTLPATIAVGEVVAIAGSQNGWTIAQNAGQTVHFIAVDSTTGVGGSLASTTRYDCIDLVCIVADLDFVVRSSVGNITIV